MDTSLPRAFYLPAETDRHDGTIMAWPTFRSVIGEAHDYPAGDLDLTRIEVANVARAIAKTNLYSYLSEMPRLVKVMASKILVNLKSAQAALGDVRNVTIHQTPDVHSLWARDTAPVFVRSLSGPIDISWGENDARGSAILNPNRNPGIGKETMEDYFANCFGIEKTIWIPGRRAFDITDDHIDALARFVCPAKVLLSKPFGSDPLETKSYNDLRHALSKATDAKGRHFTTIDVPEPSLEALLGKDYVPESGPVASYVNFHIVNGAVIVPAFHDAEKDAEAARIVGEQFPDRKIEQVLLRQLPMQGGGIHCCTQQIPSE